MTVKSHYLKEDMKNWKGEKRLIPSTTNVFPQSVIKKRKKLSFFQKILCAFYFILRLLLQSASDLGFDTD